LKKTEPRKSSASSASVTVYPRTDASDKSFGTANLPNTTAPRAKGPTAASSHKPSPSRKVVTRPLARDPKIESESMRDFADFIRSTGPSPGQEKPIQPFVNISNNGRLPLSDARCRLLGNLVMRTILQLRARDPTWNPALQLACLQETVT
jgi:hypothetical protein